MLPDNDQQQYTSLNSALTQQQIGLTAAELHGLLSGIICGGCQDDSWLVLLHNLTNEGIAYSQSLSQQVTQIHDETYHALNEGSFNFQLLLPDDDVALAERIEALSGWVNHVLLGLGVMQPRLDKVSGDAGEAIDDLRAIARLGYDPEEEDDEAFERYLAEITEYVRVAVMLCYNEFNTPVDDASAVTLH